MGFFDRFRSKKKTEQKQFIGAKQGRLTADWAVSNLTIDAMMKGSLKVLRMRSRDLELNNEYIRAYLRTVVINVVGRGIPFQGQAKDKSGAPLKDINLKIENEFYKWTNKDSCDTAGLLSFQDIEKLAVRRHEGDGEFIVQIVRKKFGNSKIPFALQLIDPDLLDENFNGFHQGNIVRMGVEIDQWSRPVAYHFLSVNPGDAGFGQNAPMERVRIPAKDIIHLFTSERAGQTRGYPRTNAAMFKLHQLKGYEEAAVVGKRVRASIMGFIQTPEGETKGDGVVDDERVTDLSPGKIGRLGEGETINVPNLGGDSGAETEPFMASMLRAVGATLGVSYESISGDFSKTNYSSSRQALILERDGWRVYQDWLIRNFHQIIFEEWLKMAVLVGVVDIQDYYANKENYTQVNWMPRGWQWVDPQKDVGAQVIAIDKGLKTYSEVLAEDGKDFQETVLQRKFEKEFMENHGVLPKSNDTKPVEEKNEDQKE